MTDKQESKKHAFSGQGSNALMESNGLKCSFNMPAALKSRKGNDGEEMELSLPPYAPRRAFLVDEYPACPEDWMRSSGKLASYFVAVRPDYGMWLNFNEQGTKFHLAIVVSVQGVNAVTGMPCEDPHLEQYAEECPKHKTKFGPHRLCEKCGFKWPKQNYICTTGTPQGLFWLDGFRAADGAVRQYIFTEEKMRGVAANVIGDKRVFAVGVSFFLSKEQRPEPVIDHRAYGAATGWPCMEIKSDMGDMSGGTANGGYTWNLLNSQGITKGTNSLGPIPGDVACFMSSLSDTSPKATQCASAPRGILRSASPIKAKQLEVAAGARIRQIVYDDPNDLTFWRENPEAIVCINYILEEDASRILDAGKIDLSGSQEGFLQSLPVGNE